MFFFSPTKFNMSCGSGITCRVNTDLDQRSYNEFQIYQGYFRGGGVYGK